MKTIVIDAERIQKILQRIAYQIIEECHEETEIMLVGILPRGKWVAEQLDAKLAPLSNVSYQVHALDVDEPSSMEQLAPEAKGKCVVIVDDILNTGRTMMQAATWAMGADAKRMITACLVDRKHRMFPIKSDFTGLSLATTIQENLILEISDQPTIYLE